MAKDGLLLLLCAGTMATLVALASAQEPDRDRQVSDTLAVQTALQRGRELTQRGDHANAIYVLESQLARINGNVAYLSVLREAYRSHIKELRLANKEAEAQRYTQRLQILDPGAALDSTAAVKTASTPAPSAGGPPAVRPAASPPIDSQIRQVRNEEPVPAATVSTVNEKEQAAKAFLAKAEQEFGQRRYREAGTLFEQAAQADQKVVASSQERWAYCKLYGVVEELNRPAAGPTNYTLLESEIQKALEMAPRLEYGKQLLGEIAKRKGGASAGHAASVATQHVDRGADGWARVETANFRIFHTQSRETAEQVAQIAEKTRAEMGQKWFGGIKESWNPRCDLFLHATSADYSKATGVPQGSPGHSSIKHEGARVLERRIDLHCDNLPNLLQAVLPHEATHVVLAGQFDQPVPRWADEGMAVLTEPRTKIDLHLQNLGKCRQENTLFSVRQLMLMNDYPDPRQISAFYAQSVSLVEYLSNERGPQVFTAFLREAIRTNNYEAALQKHFNYRNFEELQQRWAAKALTTGVARNQ